MPGLVNNIVDGSGMQGEGRRQKEGVREEKGNREQRGEKQWKAAQGQDGGEGTSWSQYPLTDLERKRKASWEVSAASHFHHEGADSTYRKEQQGGKAAE